MDKQHGKFKNFISKTKDFFLELFYPSNFTCDICGKEMDHETKYHVCEDCEKNYLNNKKICPKCGSEIDEKYNLCYACRDKQVFYKMARAPFVYRDHVKDAIHNFKYHNAKYLAVTFGNYMTSVIVRENFEFDLIVPVPLTQKRKRSVAIINRHFLQIKFPKILEFQLTRNPSSEQNFLAHKPNFKVQKDIKISKIVLKLQTQPTFAAKRFCLLMMS